MFSEDCSINLSPCIYHAKRSVFFYNIFHHRHRLVLRTITYVVNKSQYIHIFLQKNCNQIILDVQSHLPTH